MKRNQFILSITFASVIGGAIALGGYSFLEKDQKMVGGVQLEFDFWDLENEQED